MEPLSYGQKPIGCKWVFKNKIGLDSSIENYKEGWCEKIFLSWGDRIWWAFVSLVDRLTYIMFLLSIAIYFDLEIEQMDVKMIFLYGNIKEEIHMT